MTFQFASVGIGAALWASAPLFAQEKPNLIANGGFEDSVTVAITKENEQYKPLLERGVALPTGEKALMPAMVYVNPADGWLGAGHRFEYVTGEPGAAVYTGRRAVRIESPHMQSAIAIGKHISLVEGISLDDRALPVGKPHRFSLYARGKGTVFLRGYMYDAKMDNFYEYARCMKVAPEQFPLADEEKWQKLEGTLQVNCPEVNRLLVVLAVHGQATLDDVGLLPQ
jgi:hypothetical protein